MKSPPTVNEIRAIKRTGAQGDSISSAYLEALVIIKNPTRVDAAMIKS
jgi:hypothetical protein